MSRASSFATVSFYVFLGLTAVLQALDLPSARSATSLAGLGMAESVVLWWISDAHKRRVAIPYMSLWIGFTFGYLVVPVHYLSTRGLRGVVKLSAHAVLAILVGLGATFGGEELGTWVRSRPTAKDRALASQFRFTPSVLVEARLLGTDIRPFEHERNHRGPKRLDGFIFTTYEDGQEVVQQLQDVLEPGQLAFVTRQENLVSGTGATIGVVHAQDAFEVIRAVGTTGHNEHLHTEAILERLDRWHTTLGIDVYGIGPDWLALRLRTPPPDARAFAAEVHAFCPDMFDEAGLTLDALAAALVSDQTITLWWD